jgi:hypothetical protein
MNEKMLMRKQGTGALTGSSVHAQMPGKAKVYLKRAGLLTAGLLFTALSLEKAFPQAKPASSNSQEKTAPAAVQSKSVEVVGMELTMRQAVAKASRKGYRILSNAEMDATLSSGKLPAKVKYAHPPPNMVKEAPEYWTGTLVAYKAPGEMLGKTIEFQGMVVAVPAAWQDKKDVMIVCEHPAFTIGKHGTVELNNPDLVPMHAQDGWYVKDKHGIPSGKPSNSDDAKARFMVKAKGTYIGLIQRTNIDRFGIRYDLGYMYLDGYQYSRCCVLGEK